MTDRELQKAAMAQARVYARAIDGVGEVSGVIERYSAEYMRIGGAYYSRRLYVFER